jgi:hypothetical protein
VRHDTQRIDAAIAPLIGLPLWASNRAADLQSFQFGARHLVTSRFVKKGTLREVGTYALHLQCDWSITSPAGPIVGLGMSFNDRDSAVDAWLHDREFLVEGARSNPRGDLRLKLAEGFILEASTGAADREWWRLLQPHNDVPHFVVGGEDRYSRD